MTDQEALEFAWRTYGAAVTRYCIYSAGLTETGKDLAAEVFVRFATRGSSVPREKLEAWLFTVARNLCVSYHRARRRENRLLGRLGAESLAAPAGVEPRYDFGPDPEIVSAVAALSEDERRVVYLRLIEERPYSEVALLTGRSEGASRMLILRALRRMRERLVSGSPRTAVVQEGGRHA